MTLLNLKHKGKSFGVPFPTTVSTVNRVVLELKRGYDPPGPVRITDSDSPIPNLTQYIKCADPENEADIQKLNHLAAKIDGMSQQEQYTFSGALDAESVNGLDDVLRIVDMELLVPHVNLYAYGQAVAEKMNLTLSSYGVVSRGDGHPIQTFGSDGPQQGGMEVTM